MSGSQMLRELKKLHPRRLDLTSEEGVKKISTNMYSGRRKVRQVLPVVRTPGTIC